jgi:hypothetical protein
MTATIDYTKITEQERQKLPDELAKKYSPLEGPELSVGTLSKFAVDTTENHDLTDVMTAVYRTENILGSYFAKEAGMPDVKTTDFDPWEYMSTDEKIDDNFTQYAKHADSVEEIEAVRRQVARERQDRQIISDAGVTGVLSMLGQGVFDPTMLLVGGLTIPANTYRAGNSILKSGLITAGVVTGETTAQELALQATQTQRTYGESAINITASAFLSGVLGSGIQTLVNRSSLKLNEVADDLENTMDVESKIKDDINPTVNEKTPNVSESTAGAQAVFGDVEVSGKLAKKITELTAFTGPLTRTLTSDEQITRQIVVRLADNPIKVDGFSGQSVEQLAKTYSGNLAVSVQNNNKLFDAYKNNGGKLKQREFNEAVAKAVRSGKSDIPEVKQSADYWMENLYNPLKQRMIEEKLLPEDVDVSTSVNYLNRIYDKGKIADNYDEFIKRVSTWLRNEDYKINEKSASKTEQKIATNDDYAEVEETLKQQQKAKFVDTRGQKVQYHGTSQEITSLADDSYASLNIYGQGFYTTDATDIAKGYSKKGKGKKPAIYKVTKISETKLFDLEQPLNPKVIDWLKQSTDFTDEYLDELPANPTVRDALDDIRDFGTSEGKSADEIQEELDSFRFVLEQNGFEGYRHVGGGFTGQKAHNVEIFWQPSKHIKIEKIELPSVSKVKINEKEILETLQKRGFTGYVKNDVETDISTGIKIEKQVFEEQDYNDLAEQIANRILGTSDGVLPYDWQLGMSTKNTYLEPLAKLRGPMQKRVFNINDEAIEDFLINDIEVLGARYYRQTAADVELMREFGDISMQTQINDISKAYTRRMETLTKKATEAEAKGDAKTGRKLRKQSANLNKKRIRDIADIEGMRDRIRGVYNIGEDTVFSRIGRTTRDLNYLRFMGGVTISSFPDVARVIMSEGFIKTFGNGLMPLIKNTKNFKIAADELKGYGIGTDALITGRAEIIADIADYTQGGTMFERGARSLAGGFGKINVLDYWTAGMKQLQAVTMQTRIFDDLKKGKYDKRLERLGISKSDADAMWKQVQQHGKKIDGVWITNSANWDNPALARMYGAAMRKESDRVIIIPGQEKPLFMSREMGGLFFQFRSFIMSATQRVLIAGLQNQDHNVVGGLLSLIGMGTLVYAIKTLERGEELSDDPRVWVMEGIDRSGAIGILTELNVTLEKLSQNEVGLRPLLGIDAPSSKYVAHSLSQTALGPTFGSLLNDTVRALSTGLGPNEMTEADIRTLRRLLPYQNLTGARQALDKVEEAIGESL